MFCYTHRNKSAYFTSIKGNKNNSRYYAIVKETAEKLNKKKKFSYREKEAKEYVLKTIRHYLGTNY